MLGNGAEHFISDMEKYNYLEHTADGKFQAFGNSLEEAFSNAAFAMFNLMCKTSYVKTKIKKRINVNGKDKESLLYNFLEELLFLLDSENFLLGKIKSIKIIKNKKYELEAEVLGDNTSLYKFFGEVKAVTYNDMFIKHDKNKERKFIIQVVVDM